METLSGKQFEEKYGIGGTTLFEQHKKEEKLFETLKRQVSEAARGGIEKMGRGFELAKTGRSPLEGLESGLKVGAGAIETITSPLAPAFAPLGKGIEKVADVISDIPAIQKFSETKAGKATTRAAEDIQDVSIIGSAIGGAKAVPKVARGTSQLTTKGGELIGNVTEKLPTGNALRQAVRDVTPTSEALVDTSLVRALNLTRGDIANIKSSTGNSVSRFLADNNLIGNNKVQTIGNIESFFKQNYDSVRTEIGNVKRTYSVNEVPRFTESLNAILELTKGKLGLEQVNREINSLLKKTDIELKDVQRAKELLDEHFELYKVTGDVKAGVAKQGLAKVRQELKQFIENEVKEETGVDIAPLNNNVSTARGLADAIETRAPVGLTKAHVSWRDAMVGLGVYAFSTPLVGLAAVLAWKLATSPSALLRFARWLDKRTDAQRAKINESFKRGEVPNDVKEVMELNEADLPIIEMGRKPQSNLEGLPIIE